MSDKGERRAIDDVIDFYNSQIKTSEMQEFEELELDQKDTICHLYIAACETNQW